MYKFHRITHVRGFVSIHSARVVGTGSIGTRYLHSLAAAMTTPPIAVPIGGVLREASIKDAVILEAPDYSARPHVDLCVIASNTNRHLEDAMRYKDSADSLLIEKPLSFSSDSLRNFDLSYPTHEIAVASPLRFMDGFGVVRGILLDIGEILGVNVECRSWLPSWRPGTDFRRSYSADPVQGGVLLDLVHEIDYCLQLFGTPTHLAATLNHESPLGIASESTAHMLWRYGAYDLHMVLDYTSRPPSRCLSIYGTRKSVVWDVRGASVTIWNHEDESVNVLSFPDDTDRDVVLWRQIDAVARRAFDPRISTVAEASLAVVVCDLAKRSSELSSVLLDTHTALEVPRAG